MAVQKIVIATHNRHKLDEIRKILRDYPVALLSLDDVAEMPDVAETGTTFEENALLKARAVYHHTGLLTLSDDSGLEVTALNGAPGVYSARYAGSEKSTAANNRKLLEALAGVPLNQRQAQFRCVVAIVGEGLETTVEGIVRGHIAEAPRGEGGFGYDPLFIPEGYEKTFAELGEETKNQISHRAKAFRAAADFLAKKFNW
jgi:XTP/dITP diphosphohydrolase